MKHQSSRHVCFDFADGQTIGIRTLDPIEKIVEEVKDPRNWRNGIPRTIVRVWEAWW